LKFKGGIQVSVCLLTKQLINIKIKITGCKFKATEKYTKGIFEFASIPRRLEKDNEITKKLKTITHFYHPLVKIFLCLL